jgi:hypothetical protein
MEGVVRAQTPIDGVFEDLPEMYAMVANIFMAAQTTSFNPRAWVKLLAANTPGQEERVSLSRVQLDVGMEAGIGTQSSLR